MPPKALPPNLAAVLDVAEIVTATQTSKLTGATMRKALPQMTRLTLANLRRLPTGRSRAWL